MQKEINLENLDDEKIAVLENYLNEKDTRLHNEFFNSFALDTVQDFELAFKIAYSMQCIPMSILYDVLMNNIEFTNYWIKQLEMKTSYKYFLNKSIKEEKTKRLAEVLDKRLVKQTILIDKIRKI